MKKNPDMTKIVDQIKSLGMDDTQSATLIKTGSVTVGMNRFSMKNTFTAFAYGKCMNPAYGIQFGEVIKNGNSIGTPNISAEILRVSDDIRS